MSRWMEHVPLVHVLFLKIAEPRVVRILHFGIYVCMQVLGFSVLLDPPSSFRSVVGLALVYVFGGMISLGSFFGIIAVLPGVWWLERVGIIALWTSMSIWIVVAITLGSSLMSIVVPVALLFVFILRWLEIKDYQLAPREE